ncbi:MAG TPA: type 4a pilus biogenesis protein PilO [Gemmatimonadaceae bacterium]|nr:type 4a pilus biogenesis protein PilO [Gemmatimonadaceae bacterium]
MLGMPKGQREQALVLVCLVALAAVGLYWYMVFQPRSVELAEQQTQVDTLVALNDKAKIEMSRGSLPDIRRELAEYQQSLALIRSLVPSGNEVPALLEQVSTAARRVGLDVASVDPQPVLPGANYETYRYGMSMIGGYHELAQFFTNVGSLNRIMLPMNVTLNVSNNVNAQKSRRSADDAVIEAHFQLQTFVTNGQVGTADADVPVRGGN